MIALSDQRSDPSEEHAPCNKAAIARLLVQAARRQLSACQACTCVIAAGSECARGPLRQHAAPAGARRQAGGTERVISPAHYLGALRGGALLEGVAGDSAAAPAQGKAFPFQTTLENPGLRTVLITWRLRGSRQPLERGVYLQLSR
jgi:hypothetical protein